MQEIKLKDSYKVMSTTKYDLFKIMDKNRDIDHYNKVVDSIKRVGYVPVPVIVNENMEIIDGQNRFTACKELGLPVYYMTIAGLSIEHCRSLNIGQSNWKIRDYVKSYSVENISYQYLLNLMKMFPEFTPKVISVAAGSFGMTGGGSTKKINEGLFTCTEEQYELAIKILTFLRDVNEITKKVPGKIEYLHLALIFAWRNVGALNVAKLDANYRKYALLRDSLTNGVVTVEGAIRGVDDVYNYKNKRLGVDLVSAYRSATRKG